MNKKHIVKNKTICIINALVFEYLTIKEHPMLRQKEHANGGVISNQKDNRQHHHSAREKDQLNQHALYLAPARRPLPRHMNRKNVASDQNVPQSQNPPKHGRTGLVQPQRLSQPARSVPAPPGPMPPLVRILPVPEHPCPQEQGLPNQSLRTQALEVNKNLSELERVHRAVLSNDLANVQQLAIEFSMCHAKFGLFYARIDHALLPLELHCRNTPIQIAHDKKLPDIFAFLCKLSFALKKKGLIDFKKMHPRDNAILSCYKERYRSATLEELLGLPVVEAKLASTSYASIWQLQPEDKLELNVHRQKPFTNLTLFLPTARSKEQNHHDKCDDLSLSKVDLEFFNQLLDSDTDNHKRMGAVLHSSATSKPVISS